MSRSIEKTENTCNPSQLYLEVDKTSSDGVPTSVLTIDVSDPSITYKVPALEEKSGECGEVYHQLKVQGSTNRTDFVSFDSRSN